jgi:TorA maturation chaperone TorD
VTNTPPTSPNEPHPQPTDEDQARAGYYAILGRLFTGAPDAAFLQALGSAEVLAEVPDQPLPQAWNRLVEASRAMDADAAAQEYTDLFIGVGKAECNLHASYWVRDTARRPLVAVRDDLARLGISRASHSTVYEDHLGALCETMRFLVAGVPGRDPAPIAVQKSFFESNIGPWALICVGSIVKCAVANYYARVAEFGSAFLAIERDSLAID